MNMKTAARVRQTALALMLAIVAFGASAQPKNSYVLATATTGGTFYPVGVAVATLVKIKLEPGHNITMSAITSAGSGDNITLLRKGEAQFAILQGLYGAWAWNAEGVYGRAGPQRHIRAVSMLWRNVEHFVVDSRTVTGDTLSGLADLQEEKFSIGKRNSGIEGSGRHIMSALGLNVAAFNFVHMGYGPSANAMRDNKIEGMNTPAGPPVSAVTRAFSSLGDKIKILNVSDDELAKINRKFPLWSRYELPANTYPGQTRPVQTIAQPNFLAAGKEVPAEDVYLITRTIYENLPFLNGIHSATREMDLQKAIDGLAVPLHPGAARYYREMGLTIPDRLLID